MDSEEDISSIYTELRNRILTFFPDIKISSYRMLTMGWDSYVFVVNEKIAFKFPKSDHYSKMFGKEVKVLGMLDDCPVRVPKYVYLPKEEDGNFGGYNFIPGKPLNSVNVLSDLMIQQLSEFLNYLWKKTHDILGSALLPANDANIWRDIYRKFYREIRENYSKYLDSEILDGLESLFRPFITKYTTDMPTSFTHCDLYRGNVLITDNEMEIAGIIDWGDCAIGDPAIDFAALAVDFPTNQIAEILNLYRRETDVHFKNRVEFYWRIEPLYALMETVRRGNLDSIADARDILSKRLSANFEIP